MSTIPKEIEEQIKGEAKVFCNDFILGAKICATNAYVAGAEYGYQLATDGREQERNKAQIGSDEYWNKLDQNFGKTQEYHYKGEKCVAGCKNFAHYETKHHPDCPFYKNSLSKSTDDQITALQSSLKEKEKECEELKAALKQIAYLKINIQEAKSIAVKSLHHE